MSSVRKKNRSEHRFTILDIALDLYDHTTTVTANPIFEKAPALTGRIENEAALIYHYCRSANEDFDSRIKEDAEMRIKLEDAAVEQCKWLKTDIKLAKKKLHLRAKKVIFWNEMINEVMTAIKAWRKTETQRYKENHGL